MRLGAIFRESVLNLISGTSHALVLGSLVFVLAGSFASVDVVSVLGEERQATKFHAAGGSVITLTSKGHIDGAICESLNKVPGVLAAGAVRSEETFLEVATLPNSNIPLFIVSPTLPKVLGGKSIGEVGLVLSESAAGALSVEGGDVLELRNGQKASVSGTYAYPEDGRRAGFGYAALAVSPRGGVFDECWMDVWTSSPKTASLIWTVALPSDGKSQPSISQLNTTLGAESDGFTQFQTRSTQFAPAFVLAASIALGFFAIRLRRLQFAAALHAGVRARDLLAVAVLETFLWSSFACFIASLTVLLLARTGASQSWFSIYWIGFRSVSMTTLGAVLGAAIAIATTKEKQLFNYFKARS